MSRLIEADETKLMLSELLEVAEKEKFTAEDVINHAIEWLDNIPTAYDTEKVVEELDEQWNNVNCIDDDMYYIGVANALADAINIVKRGGVK